MSYQIHISSMWVMDKFLYQLDWVTMPRYLVSILDVSVKVFLDEVSI